VYILTCSDGTYYTGYTTDPQRRLREHNSGTGAKYTRGRRPVRLVFVQKAGTRGEALSTERKIKGMDRATKYELVRRFGSSLAFSSR